MSFSIDRDPQTSAWIALGDRAARPYIWLETAEIQSGRFHERTDLAELKPI
jgi:hypothetical protein